jgi:hypothetical protein
MGGHSHRFQAGRTPQDPGDAADLGNSAGYSKASLARVVYGTPNQMPQFVTVDQLPDPAKSLFYFIEIAAQFRYAASGTTRLRPSRLAR